MSRINVLEDDTCGRLPNVEWYLGRDDDGHWYIIPLEKRGEWERYLDDVASYYGPGRVNVDFETLSPVSPAGVYRIDGPSDVVISCWRYR